MRVKRLRVSPFLVEYWLRGDTRYVSQTTAPADLVIVDAKWVNSFGHPEINFYVTSEAFDEVEDGTDPPEWVITESAEVVRVSEGTL